SGYITAGGKSSRMGRDKAWLDLGGIAMIERILRELQQATGDVTVIANDPSYARLEVPVIRDSYMGIGPLEAIRTALSHSGRQTIVIVGCDLPFVTTALFEHLLSLAEGFEAVVPTSSAARAEPLCAVYSTLALPEVGDLIHAGERKVRPLFDRIRTRFVPFAE